MPTVSAPPWRNGAQIDQMIPPPAAMVPRNFPKAHRSMAVLTAGGIAAAVAAVVLVSLQTSAERSGASPIAMTAESTTSPVAQAAAHDARREAGVQPNVAAILATWRNDQEALREQIAELRDQIARYDARVSTFSDKKAIAPAVASAATTSPDAQRPSSPAACNKPPPNPLIVRFPRGARGLSGPQLASLDALAATAIACRNADVRIDQAIDPDSARTADMRLAEHRIEVIASYLASRGVDGGTIDYDTIPLATRGLDTASERDRVLAADAFEITIALPPTTPASASAR